MANIGLIAEKYDKFLLFDTETTGLDYKRDEIIEFSAVLLEKRDGQVVVTREYDNLVTLTPGNTVPPKITELTGISTQDILDRGVPKQQVCADIAEMVAGNTLLLAYNAHFDLSFLFYMLMRDGDPSILKGKDKLDLLTVYTEALVGDGQRRASLDSSKDHGAQSQTFGDVPSEGRSTLGDRGQCVRESRRATSSSRR